MDVEVMDEHAAVAVIIVDEIVHDKIAHDLFKIQRLRGMLSAVESSDGLKIRLHQRIF